MFFDVVFMIQHYGWYRKENERIELEEQQARGGYTELEENQARVGNPLTESIEDNQTRGEYTELNEFGLNINNVASKR